ncbi:MAG: hypothetical protein SF066_11325 [Thermoanaerobaculia bacterium]|nr:hypothetical protein [Thermoanaerobaculia bacterium]
MGAWKSITVGVFVVGTLGLPLATPALEPEQIVNLATANGSPYRLARVRDAVPFGDHLLFFGRDDEHGEEIWRTDGTAAGTELVLDSCPGPVSSFDDSSRLEGPASSPVRFFQVRRCGAPGLFLWATDGTAEGTRPLLETERRAPDSPYSIVGDIGDTGRLLIAKGPSAGFNVFDEIYFLDGVTGAFTRWLAAPPTIRVARSADGVGTPWRDRVFFLASEASSGFELWVSDGTGAGTFPLDVTPGAAGTDFRGPWVSDAAAWFLVLAPEAQRGLWITDGTVAGTRRVAELEVTATKPKVVVGPGRIYFEPKPRELWTSDGTAAGTRLLSRFDPNGFELAAELVGDDRLLFSEFNEEEGGVLWSSDGTPTGTTRLLDPCPGPSDCFGYLSTFVFGDAVAYFLARDDAHGAELWRSDGTPGGTRAIDLCSGPCNSDVFPLAASGDRLWFFRRDAANRAGLWRTDGTLETTVAVVGLPTERGFELAGFLSNRVVVFAADEFDREEAWVVPIEGTPIATRLRDFDPQDRESGSDPRDFWRQDGRLLFLGHDDVGDQIWSTRGTSPSTFSLWSLPGAGPLPSALGRLAVIGPWALATQTSGEDRLGRQILRVSTVDGSSVSLPGVVFPDEVLEAQGFTVVGGRAVYFQRSSGLAAADPVLGRAVELNPLPTPPDGRRPVIHRGAEFFASSGALWVSDGTAQGTTRPFGNDFISLVTATRDKLFLVGGPNDHLFVTERLPSGSLAPRVDLGPLGFGQLATTDRRLFAFPQTPLSSRQRSLVVSDGTPAGTRRLINALWPEVGEAVGLGEVLYFAAEEPQAGMELWRSDGTVEGTTRVADLYPGPAGSHPANLRVLDGRLFFTASDGRHGNELWTSDGSAEGTVRLSDIAPGTLSSNPRNLALVEGDLVFSAHDGTTGREPWRFPLNELAGRPPVPPDLPWLRSSALAGFQFKVRFGGEGGLGGAVETACIAETVCISGALPGRPEVFLRIVGPRANGYLWPTVVKFSTAEVEVWLEDEASGALQFYRLVGARPGFDGLPGLFDRRGFLPRPGIESAVAAFTAGDEEPPPPGTWFTSPALPGFRVAVTIAGGSAPVRAERECIAETLCVSGAVPGRAEVFVRIVGPKPNGFLWPTLVKFTTSELEVWIEQLATGQRQYYHLPGASPDSDDLTGVFDRTGFRP